jgi:hypothetical protein
MAYVRRVILSDAVTVTRIDVDPTRRGILGDAAPLATNPPFTVMVEPVAFAVGVTVIETVVAVTASEYDVVTESKVGVRVPVETVSDFRDASGIGVPPVPMRPDPLPSQATIATMVNSVSAAKAARRLSRVAKRCVVVLDI